MLPRTERDSARSSGSWIESNKDRESFESAFNLKTADLRSVAPWSRATVVTLPTRDSHAKPPLKSAFTEDIESRADEIETKTPWRSWALSSMWHTWKHGKSDEKASDAEKATTSNRQPLTEEVFQRRTKWLAIALSVVIVAALCCFIALIAVRARSNAEATNATGPHMSQRLS